MRANGLLRTDMMAAPKADTMFELLTAGVWCSSILGGFGLLWLTSLVGGQFNIGRMRCHYETRSTRVLMQYEANEEQRNEHEIQY